MAIDNITKAQLLVHAAKDLERCIRAKETVKTAAEGQIMIKAAGLGDAEGALIHRKGDTLELIDSQINDHLDSIKKEVNSLDDRPRHAEAPLNPT